MKLACLMRILCGVACMGVIEGINIADIELDIIEQYDLKSSSRLGIQSIGTDNTISNGITSYSLDGATPFSVIGAGATYAFEGRDLPFPESRFFSKQNGEETLLFSRDEDNSIRGVYVYSDTGDLNLEFTRVDENQFVPIASDSVDFESLNKRFSYGNEEHSDDFSRNLENVSSPYESESRGTQRACSSFKVIELAVAYESSFCAKNGGNEASARAKVESIVAGVSLKYQQTGLCTKVEIVYMEGYCNKSSDPYTTMVALNKSGCGNDGLLNRFQDYWNADKTAIVRDDAQLFTGTGLECFSNGACVIGCAYLSRLCNTGAYGVNYATFTSTLNSLQVLVAHELGHNCGGNHYNTPNHIMYPSVNPATNGFSGTTVNSFLNMFSRSSCIGDDKGPVVQPTPAPVSKQPTPATVSPVKPPVKKPSKNPVKKPTKQPIPDKNECTDFKKEKDCESDGCHWRKNKCKDCAKAKHEKKCMQGGCLFDSSSKPKCSSCSVATSATECTDTGCVWMENKCLSCRAGDTNREECENQGCAWKRNSCRSCVELSKKKCNKKDSCIWKGDTCGSSPLGQAMED